MREGARAHQLRRAKHAEVGPHGVQVQADATSQLADVQRGLREQYCKEARSRSASEGAVRSLVEGRWARRGAARGGAHVLIVCSGHDKREKVSFYCTRSPVGCVRPG
jgi:hypothetical protein